MEIERRMAVARGWRGTGGDEQLSSNEYGTVCEDIKVLKMDGSDRCTTT